MRKRAMKFSDIAQDIAHITARREQVVLSAFDMLAFRHALLAQALLANLGTRQRAAFWMSSHQRALGGRSGYEVLADGDEDSVWDQLPGAEKPATLAAGMEARSAC